MNVISNENDNYLWKILIHLNVLVHRNGNGIDSGGQMRNLTQAISAICSNYCLETWILMLYRPFVTFPDLNEWVGFAWYYVFLLYAHITNLVPMVFYRYILLESSYG